MKQLLKSCVVAVLGWQVRRLRQKNNFKLIAVVGSIGKTSTKYAIANLLKAKHTVCFQEGNYNDLITIPLVLFGHQTPALFNVFSWLKIFISNERQLRQPFPFDVAVLELGTDGPGQIKQFAEYLHLDIAVLTAIAPEHMEYFSTLNAVAQEEMSVFEFSDRLLANADLCSDKYLKMLPEPPLTYGHDKAADYSIKSKFSSQGLTLGVSKDRQVIVNASHASFAKTQLYSLGAAIAVADILGLSKLEIIKGLSFIEPVPGRMNRLEGINGSTILDDTYNASPVATIAALDTLYMLQAPQKIAILGNMNELGAYSKRSHIEVGNYCDPKKVDLIITIGPDANKYLAPAAEAKGCRVKAFDSPYEIAAYLKSRIKPQAIILAKGSQNGVFAEEAVKDLLAHKRDAYQLVRQSEHWLKIKRKAFNV